MWPEIGHPYAMIMARQDGRSATDWLAMAKRAVRRHFKTLFQTLIAAKDFAIFPIFDPYWMHLENRVGNRELISAIRAGKRVA